MEERLRSDLEYIERWSYWRDVWILWQTPKALLWPQPRPRRSISRHLDASVPADSQSPPKSPDEWGLIP